MQMIFGITQVSFIAFFLLSQYLWLFMPSELANSAPRTSTIVGLYTIAIQITVGVVNVVWMSSKFVQEKYHKMLVHNLFSLHKNRKDSFNVLVSNQILLDFMIKQFYGIRFQTWLTSLLYSSFNMGYILAALINAIKSLNEFFQNDSKANKVSFFETLCALSLKVFLSYGTYRVTSCFVQLCVLIVLSYRLSKDFKRYIQECATNQLPFYNVVQAYNMTRETLNHLNAFNSSTLLFGILYGILSFSKYFHELITSPNLNSSEQLLAGMSCVLYWISVGLSAEAHSNVMNIFNNSATESTDSVVGIILIIV